MDKLNYNLYLNILKKELIPALGCTEPIAIAYASAKARKVLGEMPDEILVECSGNIIKNVKAVIVPKTEHMKGIETSAILGAVGGNSDMKLEVLENVTKEDVILTKHLLNTNMCRVKLIKGSDNLHIIITAKKDNNYSKIEIEYAHTNIVLIEHNGEILYDTIIKNKATLNQSINDNCFFSVKNIFEFANTVKVEDIKDILDYQIDYNTKIAKEGLKGNYGSNVGSCIIKHNGRDIKTLAKAYAAAGSDARMNGCSMPVVINSGSGNQGLTASLPVIVYAKHLGVSDELKYRALVFSNLLALSIKKKIGALSAFCGVVSAAAASGAAISYLHNASLKTIESTITNTLGNISGIVCDGAKSSCAAKIASSVDAAIMSHEMAMDNNSYNSGEGLIKDTIDDTINSITRMGRDGMKETDVEILNIMLNN